MAASATTQIVTSYSASSSTATAGSVTDSVTLNIQPNWQPGTAANQIDLAASVLGTLSANTLTYTLSAFAGATGTVAFVKVREITIQNTGATALTIGPGGSNPMVTPFASTVVVRPGGAVTLLAPDATAYAVASGSADKIAVTSAGATTFKLILKGASA